MARNSMVVLALATAAVGLGQKAYGFSFASPSDIEVVQVGNASHPVDALNGTAGTVTLDDFSLSGSTLSLQGSLDITDALAGTSLTLPGVSDHDGQLMLSMDGHELTMATYEAAVGASNPKFDAASTSPRAVTVIGANGTVSTPIVLTGANDYNGVTAGSGGAAIREVYTTDGQNFWLAGNNSKTAGVDVGGLRYATAGASTSTSLNKGNDWELRTVTVANGQLYAATGSSNSALGAHIMMTVTGGTSTVNTAGLTLPTAGPTYTQITAAGNQSPAFLALQTPGTADTLYISNSSGSGGGSLDKYAFVGGVWTLVDGITSFPGGIQNVIAREVGNAVQIFVTTDTTVSEITDSTAFDTGFASRSIDTLLTAASGTQFRGISFAPTAAPVPEPAAVMLLAAGLPLLAARRRRKV